jgi:hypothetical protein
LAALVDFHGPGIIAAGYVQIDDTRLQDTAIKLANWACFGTPRSFERLVRFPISPQIEKFQTLDRFWMKRAFTIRRLECDRSRRWG